LYPRNDIGRQSPGWVRGATIFFLALAFLPRLGLAAEAPGGAGAMAAPLPPSGPFVDPAPPLAATAGNSAAADELLLLEVFVNGRSTNKIGEFTMRRGTLMARPDELQDLGFRVPATRTLQPGGLMPLSDMRGLTWTLDQKNQQLIVTAGDGSLIPAELTVDGRERPTDRRVIESGTGVTLNYDMAGTYANGQLGASGTMDFRAFSPRGVMSSNWLGYGGASSGGSAKNTAIRLDSTYQFADVNSLRRYSMGDFITTGLAWTRPVHMEGAQIRSDFSMRPDLVTFPMPSINGSAAVPSTVQVLANGNTVISRDVDAGPFEVPQLPVVSGAGTISMTVTNAMGQQVTVTQPFYASSSLLAPGLQAFGVQAGLVRRNWGSVSNDYGKIAGASIYRRGLTSKFTVEGSVEGTPGALMGGAGGVAQIGNLGVVNFSIAGSAGSGHSAGQLSAGAQRIGRVFSVGASATVATRNFLDVAAMNGAPLLRKQLSGNAGLMLRRWGSVGLAYAVLDQGSSPTPIQGITTPAGNSQVVSGNYSVQFGHHLSFYASEFKNFANSTSGVSSNGMEVGLTIPFGRRTSINVGASSDDNVQVQAQKSAPQIGDWGYDAYFSSGSSTHEFGQAQYKSPVGLFTAGVDSSNGQTTLRMESQGAVSYMDGALFRSNTIYDSFAIVDTSPMARVHVMQENRNVGSTGPSGRLLVPDMRSFDLNKITIEPTDIPPDTTIDDADREVRPQDLSGVVVKFAVKVSHAALLRMVDEAGAALPVGATAKLLATGAVFPVGYDGEAYLQDLGPHNQVEVELPNGHRCKVTFEYQAVPGEIPSVGPVRCVEQEQ
jgi:outer membrane usher protein